MSEILRLYPPPTGEAAAICEVYEDLELPAESEKDPLRPYVIINMVSSLDGKTAIKGKAGGIGSETDRETMRVLRSKVDAVMVGAGTLRAEKVSLTSEGRRSPEPLAVIAAGSGDLPLESNLLHAKRDRTVIIAPDSLSAERRNTLSEFAHALDSPSDPSNRPDLHEALRVLKRRFQVSTLLVEGGPALNHSLISNGLADELFLTLSPKLIGGPPEETMTLLQGNYLSAESEQNGLTSIYLSGDELYLRYSPRRGR